MKYFENASLCSEIEEDPHLHARAEPQAKLRGGQFAKSSCTINDDLSKQGNIATSPCFSSLPRPTCYYVGLVCIFFLLFKLFYPQVNNSKASSW
jgi:hypothetical protein